MTKLQQMAKPVVTALLVGMLAAGLQGCIGIVVGGAVVGSLAATDRRTLGAQTEDKEITFKANSHLSAIVGDAGHVDITTYNRKILLTGEIRNEQLKGAIEQDLRQITGVQGVTNELEVGGFSSFTSRSNDLLITSKITATFVDAKELNVSSIKVVTERSNVYLLGLVTHHEGDIAASLVSGISGVNRVIKMFEYISDDDLRRMNGPDGARGGIDLNQPTPQNQPAPQN